MRQHIYSTYLVVCSCVDYIECCRLAARLLGVYEAWRRIQLILGRYISYCVWCEAPRTEGLTLDRCEIFAVRESARPMLIALNRASRVIVGSWNHLLDISLCLLHALIKKINNL